MRFIKCLVLVAIVMFSGRIIAQKNQNGMTKEVIVTTFLSGFNHPSKIMDSFALLANDYHFTSPTDENNSKTEFMEAAKELGKVLTGLEIQKIAMSGDWVAVNYIFTSSIKGLETSKGTEWFRVKNGKIHESHLIYDATKWRKVFEEMRN